MLVPRRKRVFAVLLDNERRAFRLFPIMYCFGMTMGMLFADIDGVQYTVDPLLSGRIP